MTARDLAGKTSTKTLTSFTVQDTISATFSITAPALGEVWEDRHHQDHQLDIRGTALSRFRSTSS